MFFFLSKTLQYAFMPMVWLMGLLIWVLMAKREKTRKRILLFTVCLVYVLSNDFLVNMAYEVWEPKPIAIKDVKKHDIGIVLGGFTDIAQTPRDRVYVSQAADRALHAGLLYKRGLISKILVSGGSGVDAYIETTEAENIRQLLVDYGVKFQDILIENRSRNTEENARYTKEILEREYPNASLMLFTSAFHCRRAKACFEKQDLKFDLFPVDFRYSQPATSIDKLLMPTESAFYKSGLIIHEWIGYLVYKLVGYA